MAAPVDRLVAGAASVVCMASMGAMVAVSEAGYGIAVAILVLASLLSAWSVRRGGVVRTA